MDEVLLPLLGGKLENLGQVTKVKPYGMIPAHDTCDSSWLFLEFLKVSNRVLQW